MQVGDTHFAFYNILTYSLIYFYSGLPLKPLLDDLEKYCQQMIDYQQTMVLLAILPCWQCTINLCGGQPTGPLDMTRGAAMDKQHLSGNEKKVGNQASWSFLMQLCFYLGDMKQASHLADCLRKLSLGVLRAEVVYATRVFFFVLISIEQFRATGKRKFKQRAKSDFKMIMKWIKDGAINLTHKGLILQAELHSISTAAKSTPEATILLYDKAFTMAKRCGFLQDAALTCQLAAAFCENKEGFGDCMNSYVITACEQYKAWNAIVIAEHLKKRYPQVSATPHASVDSIDAGSTHRARGRFTRSAEKKHKEFLSTELRKSLGAMWS